MKNCELRIWMNAHPTSYEWKFFHWLLFIGFFSSFFLASGVSAQQIHIATVRPDEAAPGMNVVLEILSVNDNFKPFGLDGLDSKSQIVLVHPLDSNRVVFGPIEVSWDGRVLQVPAFILPNAAPGTVPFYIQSLIPGRISDTIPFAIVQAQHLGMITGNRIIGAGFGALSPDNTLVVDSFVAANATIQFSTAKPDTMPGNPRFLPVVILSKGSVRLTNTSISVDADSLDGGPGGGGGGHGFPGSGGAGFTGGGSSSDATLSNIGSAANATYGAGGAGGACASGVVGGGSEQGDQGGGGGTGAPYGTSGAAGVGALNSLPGGFGGGSGGGETSGPYVEYGGGGGGFGMPGKGGGPSDNGGNANDGRFLVPFAGGSGGGSGNSVDNGDGTLGGSGGGGGGALEIVAFDSIICNSSTISAQGDSGTSGVGIAAGGGGGSGGAIYLASPTGIRGSAAHIDVAGGMGGGGALDGLPGGMGGLGRVRIDGATNLGSGTLANVWVNGIALTPSTNVPMHDSVMITGVAPDNVNTLDTIRIYYRSQHSGWQYVDTVRAPDGSWSKWVPTQHDSMLYVAAMVEINNPDLSGLYNFEPSWLVSSASISILHAVASPFFVSVDTLYFDSVRVGRCKTLALRIANNGEAPLRLNTGTFSDSEVFSIVPDSTVTISPYSADTFEVTFCSDSVGRAVGSLSFLSNDSQNSPTRITLLGYGTRLHDSLLVTPNSVHFN